MGVVDHVEYVMRAVGRRGFFIRRWVIILMLVLVLLLMVVSVMTTVMMVLGDDRSPSPTKSVPDDNSSLNSAFAAAISSSPIHRRRGREGRIHDAVSVCAHSLSSSFCTPKVVVVLSRSPNGRYCLQCWW